MSQTCFPLAIVLLDHGQGSIYESIFSHLPLRFSFNIRAQPVDLKSNSCHGSWLSRGGNGGRTCQGQMQQGTEGCPIEKMEACRGQERDGCGPLLPRRSQNQQWHAVPNILLLPMACPPPEAGGRRLPVQITCRYSPSSSRCAAGYSCELAVTEKSPEAAQDSIYSCRVYPAPGRKTICPVVGH